MPAVTFLPRPGPQVFMAQGGETSPDRNSAMGDGKRVGRGGHDHRCAQVVYEMEAEAASIASGPVKVVVS